MHQQPHTPHAPPPPASETLAKKEGEAKREQEKQPHATTHMAAQGGTGDPKDTQSLRDDRYSDADRAALFEVGGTPNPGSCVNLVSPLKTPANRWIALSVVHRRCADRIGYPDLVESKVRALLNKLTWEKFDSISDQTIAWANKSENERDAKTLNQVIRVVFEQLTHELAFIEIYARLCRKMMERISPEVRDDGIRNTEGKPIAGGQLFRKYLLNRCQDDFERGWFYKEATNLDECYAAQKAKRRGLSLIKFIGELFKLQMLTERIMHECVKKLLGNVENPKEEEIESLCELLKTIGQQLDVPKARAHMDVYFTRMKELCKNLNVSPRSQFMLQVTSDFSVGVLLLICFLPL
jgi:translation initiation factor 4G